MSYRIKWWQKLLSYVYPITLEKAESSFNPYLEIVLIGGVLQLNTENACYSYEDKYESFGIAFRKIRLEHFHFKTALILGGGLCSIPQLLKTYTKNINIDIVEIDDQIIKLANKYVQSEILENCNIIHANAIEYVSNTPKKYDLICIDIFIDDKVPEIFFEKNFFHSLKKCTNNSTLVLMSVLTDNANDPNFNKNFKEVFPEAKILRANHNLIYYHIG